MQSHCVSTFPTDAVVVVVERCDRCEKEIYDFIEISIGHEIYFISFLNANGIAKSLILRSWHANMLERVKFTIRMKTIGLLIFEFQINTCSITFEYYYYLVAKY